MHKLSIITILMFGSLAIANEPVLVQTEISSVNHDEELVEEKFEHFKKKATIQVLNKITAKAKFIEIPVHSQVTFGTIKINISVCWKSSPYDLSENKILLNIVEKHSNQDSYTTIFDGWMLSSSPSISTLEHPVYDVVAINCSD